MNINEQVNDMIKMMVLHNIIHPAESFIVKFYSGVRHIKVIDL